jgi:putative nucleotidyltransferase with HDIG domain
MVDNLKNSRVVAELIGRLEKPNIENLRPRYRVPYKVAAVAPMTQLLEHVIQMTQRTLNASAASILLFRDNDYELFFEAVSGPVGRALKKVKLDTRYGIAGQVARTGKPLIVNDVSRSESFHKNIDDTTGFSTKSLICAPLTANQQILGVIEVLNKLDGSDFNEQDLEAVISVAATSALAIENTRLHQEISDAYKTTILVLADAVDARDPGNRGHSRRVTEYVVSVGKSLSMSGEELEAIEYAGVLHDIGKIAVDTRILTKPGELTDEEWAKVREHPVIGANILREVPFLEKAGEIVMCHHERHDGAGYPAGLKGDEIPFGARLLAVANAFDAMTTSRAYRAAVSIERSIRELKEQSGMQFCPDAVEAFISGLHNGSSVIASRIAASDSRR